MESDYSYFKLCQVEKERTSDKRVLFSSFCADHCLAVSILALSSLVIVSFFYVICIIFLDIIFVITVQLTAYESVFVLYLHR